MGKLFTMHGPNELRDLFYSNNSMEMGEGEISGVTQVFENVLIFVQNIQ